MTAFPDVVVLLPGITGSVLANREGKEIWSPSAGAIWRAITTLGGSIEALALAGDEVDDGVTAPRLIPDVTIVPGLVKIDGYTRIARYLVNELGLTEGKNYFEFPYDWRRDNRVNAARLQSLAMDWLMAWRAQGAADARLVLVGHSMGGLIARWFVECLGGWEYTRALVTLGTPHRGSLNAVDFLVHGMKKGIGPFGLDLTPLLRSYTSVYQLLPIYPCIDVGCAEDARVAQAAAEGRLPHVDATRALAARAFHQQIEDEQKRNAQDARYRDQGYSMLPIVGIEQPTYQSARAVGSSVEMLRRWGQGDNGGDGTVPRGSATPLELDNAAREIYCAEMHGSLQNDGGTLANLKGVLTRNQVDFKRMRSSALDGALSMSLDDVVLPGETLAVRVKPHERSPRVTVKLEPLVGGVVIEDTLERGDEGWQVGAFDLTAGAWRVTASADGSSPVSDLIVVAAS